MKTSAITQTVRYNTQPNRAFTAPKSRSKVSRGFAATGLFADRLARLPLLGDITTGGLRRFNKGAALFAFVAFLFFVGCGQASAAASATLTRSTTNNKTLKDKQSWDSSPGHQAGSPPGSGDTALWDTVTTQNIDMGNNLSWGRITILDTDLNIVIPSTGNKVLTLNGISSIGIDMTSAANGTNDLTIDAKITLGAAQSWTVASGRLLTIGGIVTNGTNLLTIDGAGSITIDGVIGNGNGGLTKKGTGTLTLSGSSANLYTGLTTVNSGELDLNKNGVVAIAGSLTVGDGVGGAEADIAKLLAANQLSSSSTVNVSTSGLFDLNGFQQTVDGLLNNGKVTLNGGNLVVSGANGPVNNGTILVGSGKLDVTANWTNTGFLSVVGGSVRTGASAGLFTNALYMSTGSSIDSDFSNLGSYTLTDHSSITGNFVNASTGWTTLNGFELKVDGASGVSNSGTIIVGSGTLNATNGITNNLGGLITLANGGLTGAITNNGKITGLGQLTLNGSNDGEISVINSHLDITNANWTNDGTVIVDGGSIRTGNGAGLFTNANYVSTGSSIDSDFTNTGTYDLTDNSSITGNFINSSTGWTTLNGFELQAQGAAVTTNDGTIIVGTGTLNGTSDISNSSTGFIDITNGGLTTVGITNAGIIRNVISAGGTLVFDARLHNLSTGSLTFTNNSTSSVGGKTRTALVTDGLDNDGTIEINALSSSSLLVRMGIEIADGGLDNSATITLQNRGTSSSATSSTNTAELNSRGAANDIVNSGVLELLNTFTAASGVRNGVLSVSSEGDFINTGRIDLTNFTGAVTHTVDSFLAADGVFNHSGILNILNSGDGVMNTTITAGSVLLPSTASISIERTSGSGISQLNVDAPAFTNDGDMLIKNSDFVVTASEWTNTGNVVLDGGMIRTGEGAGIFTNANFISTGSSIDSNFNNTGTFELTDDSSITGNFTNAGWTSLNGFDLRSQANFANEGDGVTTGVLEGTGTITFAPTSGNMTFSNTATSATGLGGNYDTSAMTFNMESGTINFEVTSTDMGSGAFSQLTNGYAMGTFTLPNTLTLLRLLDDTINQGGGTQEAIYVENLHLGSALTGSNFDFGGSSLKIYYNHIVGDGGGDFVGTLDGAERVTYFGNIIPMSAAAPPSGVIPEPSTIMLMLLGLPIAFFAWRRSRRNA